MYIALVKFPDGLILHSGFQSSSDCLVPLIAVSHDIVDATFERYCEGTLTPPTCTCGGEQAAEFGSTYGGGVHQAVKACRFCRSIRPATYIEIEYGFGYATEVERNTRHRDGLPKWWQEPMAQAMLQHALSTIEE